MKKIIFAIFIAANSVCLFGQQGLNNNWMSGYSSFGGLPFGINKINFYNGNPTVTYDSLPMDFNHTHANISDSAGNILFYTNGYYIADATNDTMDNGDSINAGAYADAFPDGLLIPQGALIIPKPDNPGIYYMFHNTLDEYPIMNSAYYSKNLKLTTIDMSLNNGKGKVLSKNVPIIIDSLNDCKLIACKHGNGRDWWVITHRVKTNMFYKVLVTPYGIQSITSQNIGTIRSYDTGQAKFSPDGTKYAYFTISLDVFDFDRCTGLFSNWRHDSVPEIYGNQGCAFSPNGQMLYISNLYRIWQYDLNINNLQATRNIVAEWDSFYYAGVIATLLCLPELAPDGKIYLTTGSSSNVMHVINNPDVYGMGCNVAQHSLQLPSVYFNTLPNHPNYFLGPAPGNPCNNLGLPNPSKGGAKKIQCFNNPTHDKFTLWFPVDKDVGWLEIYDVNGECIRREYVAQWSQYKTVEIGEFSAGVYYCRMRWASGEGSVRVVRLE